MGRAERCAGDAPRCAESQYGNSSSVVSPGSEGRALRTLAGTVETREDGASGSSYQNWINARFGRGEGRSTGDHAGFGCPRHEYFDAGTILTAYPRTFAGGALRASR